MSDILVPIKERPMEDAGLTHTTPPQKKKKKKKKKNKDRSLHSHLSYM